MNLICDDSTFAIELAEKRDQDLVEGVENYQNMRYVIYARALTKYRPGCQQVLLRNFLMRLDFVDF